VAKQSNAGNPAISVRTVGGWDYLHISGEEDGIRKSWWIRLDTIELVHWHKRPDGRRQVQIVGSFGDYAFAGALADILFAAWSNGLAPDPSQDIVN